MKKKTGDRVPVFTPDNGWQSVWYHLLFSAHSYMLYSIPPLAPHPVPAKKILGEILVTDAIRKENEIHDRIEFIGDNLERPMVARKVAGIRYVALFPAIFRDG